MQLSKSSGGTLERGAFLAQLEILAKSTLKFYIITPEYVYKSANIVGFDFAREARDGATLIKVNVHLEEIREVSVQYDEEEVTNPDDARLKDTGNKTQQVSSVFTGETLDEIMKIIGDPTKSALLKTSEVAQVIYKGLSGLGADLEQIKGQAEMIVRQGVGYQ